jgi:NitT/TauT family transport system permease protein
VRREVVYGPLAVLVAWQLASSSGFVNVFFVPPPLAVARELWRLLVTGRVLADVWVSLLRVLAGFALAALAGIPIGLAMGASRRVCDSLEFLVDFLRSIPGTALIPLFILLFGVGDEAKVAIGAFAAGLVISINAMYGVAQGSRTRRMAARTMRVPLLRRFVQVVLPDALPHVFVGLRLGLSTCVVLVIVSEMFLGSQAGLGHRIYESQLLYKVEEMYSCIILTGVFGYALNRVAVSAERRIVHWSGR